MTSPAGQAGSIGIGVTIDASDLSSQITDSVAKHVKPALDDLTKNIDKAHLAFGEYGKAGATYYTDTALQMQKAAKAADGYADSQEDVGAATKGTAKETKDATKLTKEAGKQAKESGEQHDKAGKKVAEAGDQAEKAGRKAKGAGEQFSAAGRSISRLPGPLGAVGGQLTKVGALFKGAGEQASSGLGKVDAVMSRMSLGVVAAAGTAASAMFGLGKSFDDVYANIRLTTGKTGDELEGLSQMAFQIGKEIPVSFEQAGAAVAVLGQRTSLTGDALKGLSSDVANVARMTGGDAATTAKQYSALLNQWGIDAGEGSAKLNELFKVSQTYGVQLGQLNQELASNGAAFQNAGFSIEDTAVLIGKLEKSGVGASQVMSGINRAFAGWAKDGKDARTELVNVVDQIRNTTDSTAQMNLAVETFGNRGAQTLITAIKNGSFSLDQLGESIGDATGTIASADADTRMFGESMTLLKNRILSELQPAASKVFNTMAEWGNKIADLIGNNEHLGEAIKIIASVLGGLAGGILAVTAAVKVARVAVAAFNLVMNANPISIVVVALAALVAGLVYAYTHFEGFRKVIDTVWQAIKTGVGWIVDAVGSAIGWIVDFVKDHWQLLLGIIGGPLGIIIGLVIKNFDTIKAVIGTAMDVIGKAISFAWNNVIKPVFGFIVDFIANPLKATWDVLTAAVQAAWTLVGTIISFAWNNVIKPVFDFIVGAIVNGLVMEFNGLKAVVMAVWNGISAAIQFAWENVISPAWEAMKAGLTAVGEFFSTTVDGIKSVWDKLRGYLAKPINFLINTVYNGGIKKAWDAIAGIVPGLKAAPSLAAIPEHATGGRINGPGGTDNVLMWGTAGEHMLTVSEVLRAGGHGLVYAMRDMIARGLPFLWANGKLVPVGGGAGLTPQQVAAYGTAVGQRGVGNVDPQGLFDQFVPGYKDGGEILPWMVQLLKGHQWAMSMNGAPYTWGDNDCSGFMSKIASVILGRGPVRAWATGSFPGGQPWVAGLGPGFSVGVHDNPGGPGGGHTAGTLSALAALGIPRAVNVESGGSHGNVAYGGPAVGADSSQWSGVRPGRFHLGIGANGFFESGGAGGGPSPDEQRGFIARKVIEIMSLALKPVRAGITAAVGDRPPEWKHVPHAYLETAPERLVDGAEAAIGKLTDGLAGAWTRAVSLASGAASGVRGVVDAVTSHLPLFDTGGLWQSGTVAANMSGHPERVLNPAETRLFDAGLLGGWNARPSGMFAEDKPAAPTAVAPVDNTGGIYDFSTGTGVKAGSPAATVVQLLTQIRDAIKAGPAGEQATDATLAGKTASGQYIGKQIGDAAGGAVTAAAQNVAGDVASATSAALLPVVDTDQKGTLARFTAEGNAIAAGFTAAGFAPSDFTRRGGTAGETEDTGKKYDAKGQLYSDTGELLDRTMTDGYAQQKAQFDQLLDGLNQVKDMLTEQALLPILKSAIGEGLSQLRAGVMQSIGSSLGDAAGPPIADAVGSAVRSAMPVGGGSTVVEGQVRGGGGQALVGGLFDEGGIMPHNTFGVNLSGHPERVLNPSQTRLFDAGLLGGWNLPPSGTFAKESNKANAVAGADFFGLSRVPILGTIVSLLVSVLLKVIGVEIDVRDTMMDLGSDFRQFRGDFQAFNASGRLMNDTSALMDRTSSSEQEAVDERVRILKQVIEAIIKYLIEKVIAPIAKAVANAAIQAGASAAGTAVSGASMGGGAAAGGVVSTLISSAGQAGVEIASEVATDLGIAAGQVITEGIFSGLQSLFPNLMTAVFSGIPQLLGGLFGGIAGAATFDSGGVASGVGMMPKATLRPERVLSPGQTASFDRLVAALEGGNGRYGTTTLHAPITVMGGETSGQQVRDHLLMLLD